LSPKILVFVSLDPFESAEAGEYECSYHHGTYITCVCNDMIENL